MSTLSRFMKQNKAIKENAFFPATKSLTDEQGSPLLFEVRPISTQEDEAIRDSCVDDVPVKGKPNLYRQKVNTSKYIARLVAAAVVEPDLLNAELQDSYGVKTPEDLLRELIDNPFEYNAFTAFVQQFNGFDVSLDDTVEQAKK